MTAHQLIGAELARQRKLRRLKQQDLANTLDVTRSCISNIERGVSRLSLLDAHTLDDALGIPLCELAAAITAPPE